MRKKMLKIEEKEYSLFKENFCNEFRKYLDALEYYNENADSIYGTVKQEISLVGFVSYLKHGCIKEI